MVVCRGKLAPRLRTEGKERGKRREGEGCVDIESGGGNGERAESWRPRGGERARLVGAGGMAASRRTVGQCFHFMGKKATCLWL